MIIPKKQDESEKIKWNEVESVADPKFYTPTSELIENIMLGEGTDNSQDIYDFPDGIDNGKELPIWLRQGVDRAEISQEMLKTQNELEELKSKSKADTKEAQEAIANKKQLIQDIQEIKTALEKTKAEPKTTE